MEKTLFPGNKGSLLSMVMIWTVLCGVLFSSYRLSVSASLSRWNKEKAVVHEKLENKNQLSLGMDEEIRI